MPVRVKQRVAFEDRLESEKIWEDLKRSLITLLIAFQAPVNVRLKDLQTARGLFIRQSRSEFEKLSVVEGRARSSSHASSVMQNALSILAHAGIVSQGSRGSWVPVSASSESISIKGVISLDPAPSKITQFMALGIHPVSAVSGHNELFDEINRIFNSSSFGVIEEESDVDEAEKNRHKSDRRFKNKEISDNRLKGNKKGVDRWPMFVLQITLRENTAKFEPCRILDNQSQVQAVLEILSAIITQWLSVHNFRPRKWRRKAKSIASSAHSSGGDASKRLPTGSSNKSSARILLDVDSQRTGADGRSSAYIGIRSFNELSRIKSGKAAFYDTAWTTKLLTSRVSAPVRNTSDIAKAPRKEWAYASTQDRHNGTEEEVSNRDTAQHQESPPQQSSEIEDDTIIWQDLITKEKHRLNSRTGAVIIARRNAPSAMSRPTSAPSKRSTRAVLPRSKSTNRVPDSPGFLRTFLQQWENPVFADSEQQIPRVTFNIGGNDECQSPIGGSKRHLHLHNSKDFEIIASETNKLSKSGFLRSQVIAQVDQKFFLVKMPMHENRALFPSDSNSKANDADDALVLIDQHAADERIRVEALFDNLVQAPPAETIPYRSSLGHSCRFNYAILPKPITFQVSQQEGRLLELHSHHFANWSILFDLSPVHRSDDLIHATAATGTAATVVIRTLPPLIAERTKADPKLLIALIRDEVWRIADPYDRRHCTTHATLTGDSSRSGREQSWLAHLGSIPPGLLDMINSRACRSACMFNDALTLEECKELVHKLAACVFPFMCAHGRPSMAPIVRLGDRCRFGLAEEHGDGDGDRSFVDAYKKWQGSGETT